MRRIVVPVVLVMLVAGCAGRKSSLLLERRMRGAISEEAFVGKPVSWKLEPVTQTQVQRDIEVQVQYASFEYLKGFFSNKAVFGAYAGKNPYFPEQLLFYVKVANRSDKEILINPGDIALTDDHGNQYPVLGQDYVTAFAESRRPMAVATRGVIEDARPGYFGVSLPVGRFFAAKPQGPFALLSQSALKGGLLLPGTVYDGLVSFWNPPATVKTLRLLIENIKTDFDASELPKASLDFSFEFTTTKP